MGMGWHTRTDRVLVRQRPHFINVFLQLLALGVGVFDVIKAAFGAWRVQRGACGVRRVETKGGRRRV